VTRIDLSKFDNADFDRGASKIKEVLWWIVRSLFFATWFPVPSQVKVVLLRMFGARVGTDVVIRSRVNITFPWRFSCGDNVWLGDEVSILSLAEVEIGSNVCVSQRAYICTGSHDFLDEKFGLVLAPISIKDHCWVGAASFISPGVTMGTASRCLPGAVVARDTDLHVTVGGVPSEPIRPEVA